MMQQLSGKSKCTRTRTPPSKFCWYLALVSNSLWVASNFCQHHTAWGFSWEEIPQPNSEASSLCSKSTWKQPKCPNPLSKNHGWNQKLVLGGCLASEIFIDALCLRYGLLGTGNDATTLWQVEMHKDTNSSVKILLIPCLGFKQFVGG